MALINKTGITNGSTIQAEHVTRAIDALSGGSTDSVIASGSFTGAFAGTASFADSASSAVSSSFAVTASYALNSPGGGVTINNNTSDYLITATGTPNTLNAQSNLKYTGNALLVTGSLEVSGSITGSAGVINQLTASFASSASRAVSSSFTTTASFVTPLNQNVTITGNQTISGSLTITNDLTVLGSSSIQYITSSQLNINDNIITVNTFTPAVRFGGLSVIDSGSSPIQSGSLLFDSQNNQWIFVHQSVPGTTVTSSVLLMGPQTFNNVGNETALTTNRLPKVSAADLGEHLTDSNITDTGNTVSINSNTTVTGSLTVTGSAQITGSARITGSLAVTRDVTVGVSGTSSFIYFPNTTSNFSSSITSDWSQNTVRMNLGNSSIQVTQDSCLLSPSNGAASFSVSAGNHNSILKINSVDRFVISGSGTTNTSSFMNTNVSIGKTTANARLDVSGSAIISGSVSINSRNTLTNTTLLSVLDASNRGFYSVPSVSQSFDYFTISQPGDTAIIGSTGESLIIGAGNGAAWRFVGNSTPPIDGIVHTNANVGLGTSTPAYLLTLASDSAAKPSTNTWTVSSDQRLKENIEEADYDTCYNVIKNLPLKRYTWKSDAYTTEQVKDRSRLGWIAQDVEAVFPKAIDIVPFSGSGDFYIEDCKSLNADQIYAAMYGTVKKLIQENETLKSELQAIKTHLGV